MKTLASLAAEYPQFKFERTPGGYAAWDMAANNGEGALQAGARTVKRLAEKLDPAFNYAAEAAKSGKPVQDTNP
jgi:hypothetical protein